MARTGAIVVFAESDIERPVELVLNRPMLTNGVQEVGGGGAAAGEEIGDLAGQMVTVLALAFDTDKGRQVGPFRTPAHIVQVQRVAQRPAASYFNPAMALVDGAGGIVWYLGEGGLITSREQVLDIVEQALVVLLDCQQIVAPLPDDVFANVEEFQRLCDQTSAKEVLVIPVIWPCDNDLGIVKDYWDDQKSADNSAISLARALSLFLKWRDEREAAGLDSCLKRINVLAHSMGNRVLRETLCEWDRYDLAQGVPMLFRNTFLIAADIENESIHRGQRGELISHASRNVVVYYASDDLALRGSKAANLKNRIASRRLGHSGPENMDLAPHNLYAVDCDDVNTRYDTPKGHSYFRSDDKGKPGVVFQHLFECLRSGRVFPQDEAKRSTILRAK